MLKQIVGPGTPGHQTEFSSFNCKERFVQIEIFRYSGSEYLYMCYLEDYNGTCPFGVNMRFTSEEAHRLGTTLLNKPKYQEQQFRKVTL